jgi:predicted hydrolase (HD superfamily)
MEWSLFCCDDLSGFIIACALVRPDKKLETLTLESLQKKWPQKSFAAGAKREHAEMSEVKLGIPLSEFMQIALTALQGTHQELGL